MGDPNEPGRISVTLKQDGKDGSWIVFHGSAAEVRAQIIDVFQFDPEGENYTAPLYDLINEATRLYKSSGNVSSALGGRVIHKDKGESPSSGSAWDRAAGNSGEPETPAVDPNVARLEAAIEAATEVADLHNIYARDKAVFDANAALLDAWKAKGQSLS